MTIIKSISVLFAFFILTASGGIACAAASHSPLPDAQAAPCPPLPPPTGPTVTVSTEAELRDQAYNAAPGTTILIPQGTWAMQGYIYIIHDGIALRGATGDRDDVILDFGGMVGGQFGILVDADDVTIADLTIRRANDHGVAIQGRDRPTLYNLHILDIGDQLVKVNPPGDGSNGSDDGLLACSRLEYTTTAPDEYTNGISAHNAHNWTVRDNEWLRIRTPENSPVPTILFWSGSTDTVVERNLLVDCYQGISFGNASHGAGDHSGGIVRNNMIYASLPHDVVIEMVHASGWLVAHNTAWLLDPAPNLTWGMEARFADSSGTYAYNLTNMDILLDRDGATATGTGNITNAEADWFADAAGGDLHLSAAAVEAIDQAATLPDVPDDFDGEVRPAGSAPDIGADEYDSVLLTPTPRPTPAAWVYLPLVLKGWVGPTPTPVVQCTPPLCATDEVYHCPDACPGGCGTICATPTPTATVPPGGDRIQPSDLVYRGAFRLPDVPGDDEHSWMWANWSSALTYYPDGDPQTSAAADAYPGSLFGVGHDWNQWVSEIGIPVPIVSPGKDVDDLNTATTLQPFADIRGGLFDEMEMPRVGLAYLPPQGAQSSGKLYFAWAPHLDEGAANPSHGWAELTLDNPQSVGAWRISDDWNYVTGDYLFDIPADWAEAHVAGRALATGRYRDGGQGAQGPALFAIAPWAEGNPPPAGATLPATTLLRYNAVTDEEQHILDGYHHSDEWTGAAWLTAGGKSAVLFVGTKGVGDCWYGNPEGPCHECEDRGWWSSGFVAQMLFYDPADLAAVAAGTMEPWQPQPYATLDIDDVLYHIESDQQKYHVAALAFDRARGLLYLLEPFADGDKPLVHVWEIDSW